MSLFASGPPASRRHADLAASFAREAGGPRHAAGQRLALGLFVPMTGVAGIWGPSAIACAELAVEEINQAGGVRGRKLELHFFNASDEAEGLERLTAQAVGCGEIDVIVGMHTSSVRRAVVAGCGGRVPYIYTALHEGVESSRNVHMLGETPQLQLAPVLRLFASQRRARRWMFVGNNYVWPHVSHALARRCLREAGAEVGSELYVPLGCEEFSEVLQRIEDEKPDAVLLSLVGQDAVLFNRAFGEAGLGRHCLRLSCAVEENMLLAIGAANTERLYASAGYFAVLADDANMAFKERYHQRFGARAPTLNTLGQSTYEGVHFAQALVGAAGDSRERVPHAWKSVRGVGRQDDGRLRYPIHLARADGHFFRIEHSFA